MTVFKQVYFRIEAGYVWGKGYDKETSKKFENEILRIFSKKLQWQIKQEAKNGSCYEFNNGISSLYCHAMDISGIIDIELIPAIENELKASNVIEFIKTDIYKEYLNISHETAKERIKERKNEIIKDLFNIYQTKSINQYFYIGNSDRLIETYNIDTIDKYNDRDTTKEVIEQTLGYMSERGLIVTAFDYKDTTIYRALNKTEFNAWKKKNPALLSKLGV